MRNRWGHPMPPPRSRKAAGCQFPYDARKLKRSNRRVIVHWISRYLRASAVAPHPHPIFRPRHCAKLLKPRGILPATRPRTRPQGCPTPINWPTTIPTWTCITLGTSPPTKPPRLPFRPNAPPMTPARSSRTPMGHPWTPTKGISYWATHAGSWAGTRFPGTVCRSRPLPVAAPKCNGTIGIPLGGPHPSLPIRRPWAATPPNVRWRACRRAASRQGASRSCSRRPWR